MGYSVVAIEKDNNKIVIKINHGQEMLGALTYLYDCGLEVEKIVTDAGAYRCSGLYDIGGLVYYKNDKIVELVTKVEVEHRSDFN